MSSASHAPHAPCAPEQPEPGAGLVGAITRAIGTLKDAGIRWSDDACYRMAASLAFYAIFSLFPMVLVAVVMLGFLLGDNPSSRESVLGAAARVLSPQFQAVLDETLASMQSHQTARGVGAVIGGLTLVFGASGVFSELETSLSTIWRVAPPAGAASAVRRALREKVLAFAAVVVAGVLLLASLFVSTALSALGTRRGVA